MRAAMPPAGPRSAHKRAPRPRVRPRRRSACASLLSCVGVAARSIGAAGLQHNVETGAIFVASADTFIRLRTTDQPLVLFRAAEKFD